MSVTAADLLRAIAKTLLDDYIKNTLEALRAEEAPEIKEWIKDLGTAKVELGLCEALVETLFEHQKKLRREMVTLRQEIGYQLDESSKIKKQLL